MAMDLTEVFQFGIMCVTLITLTVVKRTQDGLRNQTA